MKNINTVFNKIKKLKVGVIGDVMLDRYVWGEVERISPEAPIPIVSLKRKENRIGGAGNVALNCASLGAQVFVLSVLGKDEESTILEQLFKEQGISTKYISNSNNRITTTKTRIISRNQQMMRLDSEVTNELNATDENNILRRVKDFIIKEKPDVMIFEDYNKGVLTNKIIGASISYCKEAGIITAADPKRKNFFSYKGVDIFKPNLKEVNEALNIIMDNPDLSQLKQVHAAIGKLLNHKISLITLSEKGIFWNNGKEAAILTGYLRNIADVSGAGDTVIATASLMFAVTKNIATASVIANIAGGLVCEEVGTIAIDRKKLLAECSILMK